MKFGSVCSGIEAASVAWHPLGWSPSWFAEVDRAASNVLAYRYPEVANHGDMTALPAMVAARLIEAPDILVGGTPCQAFSVAGRREGLADVRGQLTLSYVDLVDAIDRVRTDDGDEPCIAVWENVPGVLSSKDNAFGCFLAGLAGEDVPLEPPGKKWGNAGVILGPKRTVAWRIVDAQYVGLAQRRRRVFVVASAREGFDPAAVLLEFDGVRRDSAPRREKREGVTHPTAPCLTSSGRGVERTGDSRGQDPVVAVFDDGIGGDVRLSVDLQNIALGGDTIGTLDTGMARGNRGYGVLDSAPVPPCRDGRDVSQTLDAVLHKGQTMPEKNRFPAVLQPINPTLYSIMAMNSGKDYKAREVELPQPLMANGPVGGNQGGDFILQPIAFSSKDYGADASVGVSPTLRAGGHTDSHANAGIPPAIAYAIQERAVADTNCGPGGKGRGQPIVAAVALRGRESGATAELGGDVAGCLRASGGGGGDKAHALVNMAVRRLMPIECERLQGFPDNWTLVPTGKNGKLAADGPRYKQLGNSMAVNVMRWIGLRIRNQLDAMFNHNGGPMWAIEDMFD